MIVKLAEMELQSRAPHELIDITPEVERVVKESGVQNGLVNVLTNHVSSGIIVTEGLECLERDILAYLDRIAPDDPGDNSYHHNRYLRGDGRLGFNAGAHLKSILGGISAHFIVKDGQILKGSRQRVYFAEYDGPLHRTYCIQVIGE